MAYYKGSIMAQKTTMIPTTIKNEIAHRVDTFNKKHHATMHCEYYTNIKGKFIYLMRRSKFYGSNERVCRLEYDGNLEKMNFAVFKYSSETYDSDTMFVDGAGLFDGTIEGAMKAGLKIYPM